MSDTDARALPKDSVSQIATNYPVALCTGIFLLSLMPLIVAPVLPMIDFYNHVARFLVMAKIDQSTVLQQNYAVSWKVLPNLGLDVLAQPIFRIFPTLIAAKIVIFLIFAVQFGGSIFLNIRLNGRISVVSALLAGMLLYSYIFVWGFANFLLASGLILWGLGLWLWLRPRLRIAVPVCALFAVLIFFCHGFAFAMYGLTLALFEFGRWLREEPRELSSLLKGAAGVAVQAILPAFLFRMAPTSEAGRSTGEIISAHAHATSLASRIGEFLVHQANAITRVANSPSLYLDLASFILIIGLLLWAWRKDILRLNPIAIPAIAVLCVLCLITPPTLFGVGKISDRVPLLTALIVTSSLSESVPAKPLRAWLVTCLAALFVVRLGTNIGGISRYDDDFRDFQFVARHAPRTEAIGMAIPPASAARDRDGMRCEMYAPMMVALYGVPTPLFAFASQQPITLIGDLAHKAARGPTASGTDPLELPDPPFNYYLGCDYKRVPAARFEIVAQQGRLVLLRKL